MKKWRFPGKFWNGPYLGGVEGYLAEKFRWIPAGRSVRVVGWNFFTGPQLGSPEEVLVGNLE